MGYKEVFAGLQEIFPQVDYRILKAFAIEHPKDIDAAAVSIVDILPSLTTSYDTSCTVQDTNEVKHPSTSAEKVKEPMLSRHQEDEEPTSLKKSLAGEDTVSSGSFSSDNRVPSCFVEHDSREPQVSFVNHLKELERPTSDDHVSKELNEHSDFNLNARENGFDLNLVEKVTLPSKLYEFEEFVDSHNNLSHDDECPFDQPVVQQSSIRKSDTGDFHHESETFHNLDSSVPASFQINDPHSPFESKNMVSDFIAREKVMSVGNFSLNCSNEQLGYPVQPLRTQNLSELETDDVVLDFHISNADIKVCETRDFKNPQSKSSDEGAAENGVLLANADNPCTGLLTRSGHFVDIVDLRDLISDAKSSKVNLFSAVESMTSVMKEVELHEERSKHAKEAASSAAEDILSDAEELKKILIHAKEAKDMHAGEIYGEKAILATEARELQYRLFGLSNDTKKSLTLIGEIQQTLEARLAAVKVEIAIAEQEKLEKEVAAGRILSEQEAIMASVVEESKKLQEEAEVNSKITEFLMDNGHVVDALQGEIAIICDDIMLLKERIDGGLPFGRSLRSLASSFSGSLSSSYNRSKHSSEEMLKHEDIAEKHSTQDDPMTTVKSSIAEQEQAEKSSENHGTFTDGWEILKDGEF
ncbi:uncharacterized protein LOC122046291 [Zingiber officinale]|uniref:uncharacterized protein LOC122046291 n=1 Tax=Zingiber officinale TaxID=94328 RepID=UPI001C4CFD2D|nr:uncharacterized protein LOC122046291 [Zingiber officinale]